MGARPDVWTGIRPYTGTVMWRRRDGSIADDGVLELRVLSDDGLEGTVELDVDDLAVLIEQLQAIDLDADDLVKGAGA